MTLHNPDNIKVHLAAVENMGQCTAVSELGFSYALFTAYPFLERRLFKKAKSPMIISEWMKGKDVELCIPKEICSRFKHVIQDSGLFTLMFGSSSTEKKPRELVYRWYDNLVEFTLKHGQDCTVVECDVQNILGVDEAWEFRQRMRTDLPNNRQINVFHLTDKRNGLDRLIEFSDYIALSIPELRLKGKSRATVDLVKYIKSRKPSCDIHLLGCTDLAIIKETKSLCTSCDSSSYTSAYRYGSIAGRHIRYIKSGEVAEKVGQKSYKIIRNFFNENNASDLSLSPKNKK